MGEKDFARAYATWALAERGERSFSAALPLLKHVFPFDLQVYLRFHYSKVAAQTRLMLDSYIELGAARRLPVSSLQNLRLALPEPAGA